MENEQFSDTTPATSLIPPFPRDSRGSLKVFNPHHLKLRCQRCRHRTPRHCALVPDPSLRDRAIHCITRSAESFFHVRVDLSDAPDLASSHMRAGQYLQLSRFHGGAFVQAQERGRGEAQPGYGEKLRH
ncbi:hypothetical protein FF1_014534 [Malus domestica]